MIMSNQIMVKKVKLCYMDTDSLTAYIKTNYIYKGIVEDVEITFYISNYESDWLLPKEKSKKIIGSMKDELGRKFMTKFTGLTVKTYSYWTDDHSEDKKSNNNKKKVCHKTKNLKIIKIMKTVTTQLENNISYLGKSKIKIDSLKGNHKPPIKNNKSISKIQQSFKSERHIFFTKETDKILLSSNDDKRKQSIDSRETYAYGISQDLVS